MPKNKQGIGMKVDITTQWQNIYTLTGFAAGSELAIKPDGQAVYIVAGGVQPTISPANGDAIQPFTDGFIPQGYSSVWISTWPNTVTATIRPIASAALTDEYIPIADLMSGNASITTKTETEAADEKGLVRVFSARLTVAAGNYGYIGFTTGQHPFTITGRLVNQNGSTEVRYSAEEDKTYSGGSVITPRNPNRKKPITIGITAKLNPTPSGTAGTIYLDPYSIFGSGPASGRIGSDVNGLEYQLKEETDHVFTIHNAGSGSADVFWWIVGFENIPDILI